MNHSFAQSEPLCGIAFECHFYEVRRCVNYALAHLPHIHSTIVNIQPPQHHNNFLSSSTSGSALRNFSGISAEVAYVATPIGLS